MKNSQSRISFYFLALFLILLLSTQSHQTTLSSLVKTSTAEITSKTPITPATQTTQATHTGNRSSRLSSSQLTYHSYKGKALNYISLQHVDYSRPYNMPVDYNRPLAYNMDVSGVSTTFYSTSDLSAKIPPQLLTSDIGWNVKHLETLVKIPVFLQKMEIDLLINYFGCIRISSTDVTEITTTISLYFDDVLVDEYSTWIKQNSVVNSIILTGSLMNVDAGNHKVYVRVSFVHNPVLTVGTASTVTCSLDTSSYVPYIDEYVKVRQYGSLEIIGIPALGIS